MESAPPPRPSKAALFLTYGKIGLVGFGGINAWARRILVEEKRWLTEQEYAETLGLGQVLPGPNALNAAIMVGERFHGVAGSLIAAGALFGGPLVVLAGLATLYDRTDRCRRWIRCSAAPPPRPPAWWSAPRPRWRSG